MGVTIMRFYRICKPDLKSQQKSVELHQETCIHSLAGFGESCVYLKLEPLVKRTILVFQLSLCLSDKVN